MISFEHLPKKIIILTLLYTFLSDLFDIIIYRSQEHLEQKIRFHSVKKKKFEKNLFETFKIVFRA